MRGPETLRDTGDVGIGVMKGEAAFVGISAEVVSGVAGTKAAIFLETRVCDDVR